VRSALDAPLADGVIVLAVAIDGPSVDSDIGVGWCAGRSVCRHEPDQPVGPKGERWPGRPCVWAAASDAANGIIPGLCRTMSRVERL